MYKPKVGDRVNFAWYQPPDPEYTGTVVEKRGKLFKVRFNDNSEGMYLPEELTPTFRFKVDTSKDK